MENLLDTFDAFDTNISVLNNIRSIFVQKKDTMLLSLKYDYRTFVSTEVYNTTLGHDTSIPDYDSSTYSSMPKPKSSTQATFLNKYPINLTPPDPVLSPFEFRHPNTPGIVTRTVNIHKLLKAKLPFKCTSIDTIFTFYNNVRHIASSYNIFLQLLHLVTHSLGTCSITPDNCIGFALVKDVMSTALYLKLASYDYFPEFPHARTYVQTAASNSNVINFCFVFLNWCILNFVKQKGELINLFLFLSILTLMMIVFTLFLLVTKTISCTNNYLLSIGYTVNVNKQYFLSLV